MVTTEHKKAVRVNNFEGIQEKNTLKRKETTIDVVTKEEVLNISRITSNLKKFQQVIELTVNVATN